MDTVQVHVIECYLKCPTFTVSNGCPVTTPTEPVRGNIHKSTHHPFVTSQKVNISFIYEYFSIKISLTHSLVNISATYEHL